MNWNTILFGIFPYIALTLAVVVTAYRMVYRPFSVSAQSSQLLEQKRLFYGSIAMHWGLVLVLLGHLLALLIPKGQAATHIRQALHLFSLTRTTPSSARV